MLDVERCSHQHHLCTGQRHPYRFFCVCRFSDLVRLFSSGPHHKATDCGPRGPNHGRRGMRAPVALHREAPAVFEQPQRRSGSAQDLQRREEASRGRQVGEQISRVCAAHWCKLPWSSRCVSRLASSSRGRWVGLGYETEWNNVCNFKWRAGVAQHRSCACCLLVAPSTSCWLSERGVAMTFVLHSKSTASRAFILDVTLDFLLARRTLNQPAPDVVLSFCSFSVSFFAFSVCVASCRWVLRWWVGDFSRPRC